MTDRRCGYEIAFVSAFHGLGMGGAEVAPEIQPGSQEVIVDVTLQYEIK